MARNEILGYFYPIPGQYIEVTTLLHAKMNSFHMTHNKQATVEWEIRTDITTLRSNTVQLIGKLIQCSDSRSVKLLYQISLWLCQACILLRMFFLFRSSCVCWNLCRSGRTRFPAGTGSVKLQRCSLYPWPCHWTWRADSKFNALPRPLRWLGHRNLPGVLWLNCWIVSFCDLLASEFLN